MKQKVAVVLINYQDRALPNTLECLDSLTKLKTKHLSSVYIVNHDSASGSLAQHPTLPKIIESKTNLGFAGHNNLGIKQALQDEQEYIILLNNDTRVDSGFVDPLMQTLQDPKVALVSPKIYFAPGHEFHQNYNKQQKGKVLWYAGGVIDWQNMLLFHRGVDEVDRGQFDEVVETDFATGCCVAFSRQTLDKISFMPEDYFMYLEDADWSMRAKQAGLKVLYQPHSAIWHKNAGSTGGSGSEFHNQYLTKNRLKFALKYAPLKTKLLVAKASLSL